MKRTDEKCMEYALYLLSRKQYSVSDLSNKLSQKYSLSDVELAINKCLELKYLDDLLFQKAFIKDKQRFNKWGKKKIVQELKRHGISLNELFFDQDLEIENAINLLEKKNKGLKKTVDEKSRREKLKQYLYQRGFEYDTISVAIENLK